MKKYLIFVVAASLLLPIFSIAAETSIEDGIYEVDVALWHAYEDKPSMGNQGLERKADMKIEDGHMELYLKMKTLTVGELTTSVTRIFYANEESKSYKLAKMYAYDIEIPNETLKRPQVFVIPLQEKNQLYSVFVDPKVPAMGVEPIKARLKVNWDTLVEKATEVGPYFTTLSTQNNQPLPQQWLENNILLNEPIGLSGDIRILPISKNALEKLGLKLGILDQVKAFNIYGVEPIVEIPFDTTSEIEKNALAFSLTENATILFQNEDGITNVFYKEKDQFKEIDFEKTEQGILVKNVQFGTFALVKKFDEQSTVSKDSDASIDASTGNQKDNNLLQNSSLSSLKNEMPKPKPIVKPKQTKKESVSLATETNKEPLPENNENVVPQHLESHNQNNKLYSDTFSENSTIYLAAKEHKGVIGIILVIYFSMLTIGLVLWKKFLPLLMEERDRSRYLAIYSLQKNNEAAR